MKRLFDLLLAAVGLVVLSPLFLVVAVLIWMTDGWPVFFVQERVGRGGRPFRMYKFRSMVKSNSGPLITVAGDARVTKVGRLLRATKLDELPQLINVLKGEMSFVGPRPEVQRYVDLYSPEQRKVLELTPGITDPASLHYFNESEILQQQADPDAYYIQKIMPHKIAINLEYAARANIFTDLIFIVKTVLRAIGLR